MKPFYLSRKNIYFFIVFFSTFSINASNTEITINKITYSINPEGESANVSRADSNLEEVCIPSSIDYDGIKYEISIIGGRAFQNCHKLKTVTLPNSITSIDEKAFEGCYSLKDIELPHSIKTIGSSAFNGCGSLRTIEIPDSVALIEDFSFSYCSNLSNLRVGESVTSIGQYAFFECTNLNELIIPNAVTSVGPYAFKGCHGLDSVIFGQSVTRIGEHAFENCEALDSLSIGPSVTSIGQSAFYNCSGLKYLSISDSVKTIGENAFRNCNQIESLEMGNSVKTIKLNAFYGCDSLQIVKITDLDAWCDITFELNCSASPVWNGKSDLYLNGEKLTDLEVHSAMKLKFAAFAGCRSIERLRVENGIKFLGSQGREFQSCQNLKTVYLPPSLQIISAFSFASCLELEHIYSYTKTPPYLESYHDYSYIGSYPFANCNLEKVTLHVPIGTKDRYLSVDGWRNFNNIIEDLESDDYEYNDVEEFENIPIPNYTVIYNLQGMRIRHNASQEDIENLPSGVYVIGGKIRVVK